MGRTKETTNEKRAGRKFDEVNKAYEVLQAQWGCKGGRVATAAQRNEMRKELHEMFAKEQGGGGGPRRGGGGGFPFGFGGGGGGFPGRGGFPGGARRGPPRGSGNRGRGRGRQRRPRR